VPPDDPDYPRVHAIEQKMDFYMAEAVRLQKLSRRYKNEIQQWRAQVEELGCLRPGLLSIFKSARRQNQLFEAVSKSPESPTPGIGGAAGGTASSSSRRPHTGPGNLRPRGSTKNTLGEVLGGGSQLGGTMRLSTAPACFSSVRSGPLSPGTAPKVPATARGSRDPAAEATSTRTKASLLKDITDQITPAGANEDSSEPKDAKSKKEPVAPKSNALDWLDRRVSALARKDMASKGPALPEFGFKFVDKQTQYLQEIHDLEAEIEQVKQEVHDLKASHAQGFIRRGWLEEFFLLCMDDLRKEFFRRKWLSDAKQMQTHPSTSRTLGRPLTGPPLSSSGKNNDCEERRLLSSSQSSPDGRSSEQSSRRPATARDLEREEILEVLVGSEDLLAFLFERLFPHRGSFFNIKRRDGGGPGLAGQLSETPGVQPPSTPQALPPMPSFEKVESEVAAATSRPWRVLELRQNQR